MVHYSYFFTFVIATFGFSLVKCAEFVPVYMWGTGKTSDHVPALHKISEDSFKDTLLELLKKDPYVIVFAEHTLSPEDFAQRDQNGEIPFPNLLNLKKSPNHPTYRHHVQNPIGAIKQLDKPVTELSIGSLLNSPNVPKNSILIIDLNDAKDDEQRSHMLKRHDHDIVSIYKDILEQHDNVLAIYTAHHSSWVAPEEVAHKKTRSLLDDNDDTKSKGIPFVKDPVLMYISDVGTYNVKNTTATIDGSFGMEVKNESGIIHFTLSSTNQSYAVAKIDFLFAHDIESYWRYWTLQAVELTERENNEVVNFTVADIYAPFSFSYHCGDLNLKVKGTNTSLTLPGFQIQFFDKSGAAENRTFGDAYDCVGFTSVPIWSGLFVTAILLLIMTFGLTMMMDIKTMDRFDDAKGKTITINASE